MSLFLLFAALLTLLSCLMVVAPLWHSTTESTRQKAAKALIFIVIIGISAAALYLFIGAPNIVMFTA